MAARNESRTEGCNQSWPSIPTEDTGLREAAKPDISRGRELKGSEGPTPSAGTLMVAEEDTSDQFQVVAIDLDGDRALNRRQGNHQALRIILRQHTF